LVLSRSRKGSATAFSATQHGTHNARPGAWNRRRLTTGLAAVAWRTARAGPTRLRPGQPAVEARPGSNHRAIFRQPTHVSTPSAARSTALTAGSTTPMSGSAPPQPPLLSAMLPRRPFTAGSAALTAGSVMLTAGSAPPQPPLLPAMLPRRLFTVGSGVEAQGREGDERVEPGVRVGFRRCFYWRFGASCPFVLIQWPVYGETCGLGWARYAIWALFLETLFKVFPFYLLE
jgi:hypothetical protein